MTLEYNNGVQKQFLQLVAGLVGLLAFSGVVAEPAEYQLGIGLLNFEYTEYGDGTNTYNIDESDDNVFLDAETGLIPGIIFKRKQYHATFFTELETTLHGNRINYDGQTQDGVPVKTDSIAIIFDGNIKIGTKLAGKHEPYLGMGYRYWYRHIQNGRDNTGRAVAGLLEHYRWFYWLAGYAADFRASDTVSVGYDFRYTKMMNAKMDIDFLGFCGYDDGQVNLGNESGARISLPVKIKTTKHVVTVTPYYEMIDIGKSNIISLTRNGNLVDCDLDGFFDGALEPRSETRNIGIEFTWLW